MQDEDRVLTHELRKLGDVWANRGANRIEELSAQLNRYWLVIRTMVEKEERDAGRERQRHQPPLLRGQQDT